MKKNSNDTKSKIMEVAFELFGRYGVEGTSIREIAKQSQVNLAAINYHFESKENLFWHIMHETYLEVHKNIKGYSEQSADIYQLSSFVFDYFLSERMAVKNTMKMMLTEGMGTPKDPDLLRVLNNPMGPPGGEYFAEKIIQGAGYPLSREGVKWGIKAIFGSIMHWTVMLTSDSVCTENRHEELMSDEQIKKDVMQMVEASMDYLKAHPDKFRAKN